MIKNFRTATRKTACLFFALFIVLGILNISNASIEEQSLYTPVITVDGKKAEIDLNFSDRSLYVPVEKHYPN